MNLNAEIVGDLEEIEKDLGSDPLGNRPRYVIWRQRPFPAIVTSFTESTLIDVGASPVEAQRGLIMRKELFLNDAGQWIMPKSGDLMLVGGTAYRVVTVREDATGAALRITLADKDNAR